MGEYPGARGWREETGGQHREGSCRPFTAEQGPSQPSHGPPSRIHLGLCSGMQASADQLFFLSPFCASADVCAQECPVSPTCLLRLIPLAVFPGLPSPILPSISLLRLPTGSGPLYSPLLPSTPTCGYGPPSLWPRTPPSEELHWLLHRSHHWSGKGNGTSCPQERAPLQVGPLSICLWPQLALLSTAASQSPEHSWAPRGPSVKYLLNKQWNHGRGCRRPRNGACGRESGIRHPAQPPGLPLRSHLKQSFKQFVPQFPHL